MHRLLMMVMLLCGMGTVQAEGGLDIYFVRHAETLANATGVNNNDNSNIFSKTGDEQVSALTDKLKPLHFDAILVSPVPRAINTILPYLKETGQKGEIWPEIAECCWQQVRDNITPGNLVISETIQLNAEQTLYFTFRDTNSKHNYGNLSYADGVAQVRAAEGLLKKHYFGTGKTILIVAHYHSGQVLLADLLGMPREDLPNLENAKLTHLHQCEDGHFTLLSINDKDVAH